jgi:hypothetical protein
MVQSSFVLAGKRISETLNLLKTYYVILTCCDLIENTCSKIDFGEYFIHFAKMAARRQNNLTIMRLSLLHPLGAMSHRVMRGT